MSQFYVSGPAQVFTGTGISGALEFLGYTESGVSVSISGVYEDVQADYAGGMPADVAMLGEDATISGLFVRYNEGVVNRNMAFIRGKTIGEGSAGTIGTLLQTEGGSTSLVVYSPYGFKAAYSGTMIAGFHFPNAYLNAPYQSGLSVRNKKIELSWRAIPTYVSAPYFQYTLFSTSMPTLPPIN